MQLLAWQFQWWNNSCNDNELFLAKYFLHNQPEIESSSLCLIELQSRKNIHRCLKFHRLRWHNKLFIGRDFLTLYYCECSSGVFDWTKICWTPFFQSQTLARNFELENQLHSAWLIKLHLYSRAKNRSQIIETFEQSELNDFCKITKCLFFQKYWLFLEKSIEIVGLTKTLTTSINIESIVSNAIFENSNTRISNISFSYILCGEICSLYLK